MSFTDIALQLWPAWALGLWMIYLTLRSEHRSIMRVELKPMLKFVRFLAIIAVMRFFAVKYLMPASMIDSIRETAHLIPWQAILGVPWEDACHSMPLVLAGLLWGGSKWYPWLSKAALVVVMASFASGHIYQGILPAIGISAYILVSMHYGKKFGFGTVMLCHIMYDMSTLMLFKWMTS